MNDRQHVRFDLPSPVWFELATIAQKRDTTVADLISEAVRATVQRERDHAKAQAATRAEIARLVRTGLTDMDIASRLNVSRTYVCNTRRNAGLPLNRPGMANHQKETA